jgi:hypothetical protein
MHRGFGWQVPAHFNIAAGLLRRAGRAADAAQRVAIVAHGGGGGVLTFANCSAKPTP